jgi:hypothetical protein
LICCDLCCVANSAARVWDKLGSVNATEKEASKKRMSARTGVHGVQDKMITLQQITDKLTSKTANTWNH